MNIDSSYHNGYRVISVKDHIGVYTDIGELVTIVEQALQQNETWIAFSFTDKSYLFSNSIRVIMQCFELIKDNEGTLGLVRPNDDILSTFNVLDLDKIIKVFPSLDEIE